MALVLLDRVQQTGTANTTVSFTLSGTVAGYQSWSAVGNGNTAYYGASDVSGNWEVGLGTYSTTGPTLTRTTIYASSNAGAAVTFSGTVNVWVDYPAGQAVFKDAANTVNLTNTTNAALNINTASSLNSIIVVDTGSAGANIKLTGNGGTTPSKYIRANSGNFDVLNNAYSAAIFSVSDSGVASAPIINASNGLLVNNLTISASYSIPSGSSAMSTGPITVASGVAVTIPSGSKWVIL